MLKQTKITCALMTIVLMSGCASIKRNNTGAGNTATLQGLQQMAYQPPKQYMASQKATIRQKAISETAVTIGAQSGLAYGAKQINMQMLKHAAQLENVYNFNALLIDHKVLPPVLQQGQNTLNLASPQSLRIADKNYKILKQARFVTTAPNWRQYLWLDYKLPEKPDKSLLPKDNYEQKAWVTGVTEGWKQGLNQANHIFRNNLAVLKRDYEGMILYKKLLAQNMVSPPYVSRTNLGITGNSSEINIGDRVLRIVALPELNKNSQAWIAAVRKNTTEVKRLNKMSKLANRVALEITNDAWQPVISRAK